MNLTILGFSPPYTNPGRATSSYLLEVAEYKLLLDCGHGSVGRLLERIQPNELNGILISHMHPDHFYDLIVLRNTFFKRKLKKIPLYLPPEGKIILQDVIQATRLPENYISDFFDMTEYDPQKTLEISNFSITMSKNIHPINTYAMKFEEKNNSSVFIYTSDTAAYQGLSAFCKSSDLIMVECTDYPQPTVSAQRWHLSPEEVVALLKESKPTRCIITHYEAKDKANICKILGPLKNETNIYFAEEFGEYLI